MANAMEKIKSNPMPIRDLKPRDSLVSSSQRELYQVQDALVQSDATVATDVVALYKALGGGWKKPPTSPPPANAHEPSIGHFAVGFELLRKEEASLARSWWRNFPQKVNRATTELRAEYLYERLHYA